MTETEITQLLEDVAAGHVRPPAAIARLEREAGYETELAREAIFTALGGGDLIEEVDGVEVYYYSRRPVRDVLALLGESGEQEARSEEDPES